MKIALISLTTIVMLKAAASAQPNAEDLYMQGQAAYERNDYATAVAKWQASYDASKEVGLLFNLAQAKRLSGDCPEALATYQRFIRTDTDLGSEQHKLAEDLARELEGTCPQKPAVAKPPVVEEIPPLSVHEAVRVQPGRTWKIAGLITGGSGVATLALGLGLGRHGASIGDEITAACQTSCEWAALKDKDTKGKHYVSIGRMLDVGGVIGIAGGSALYYLGVRQGVLTITPPTSDGGTAVSWSQRW